jgi:hypothetical protein
MNFTKEEMIELAVHVGLLVKDEFGYTTWTENDGSDALLKLAKFFQPKQYAVVSTYDSEMCIKAVLTEVNFETIYKAIKPQAYHPSCDDEIEQCFRTKAQELLNDFKADKIFAFDCDMDVSVGKDESDLLYYIVALN